MSGIKLGKGLLSGKLSGGNTLVGKLSVPLYSAQETYTGDYRVVPQPFNAQTLQTANRVLNEDIVVTEIPYWETSNESDGITVYIGE